MSSKLIAFRVSEPVHAALSAAALAAGTSTSDLIRDALRHYIEPMREIEAAQTVRDALKAVLCFRGDPGRIADRLKRLDEAPPEYLRAMAEVFGHFGERGEVPDGKALREAIIDCLFLDTVAADAPADEREDA